ncbi:hypothetical protein FLAN108750_04615 [Flavobacterium antarcticum]|uniref:hypothetical protein n=1 Tax=Flavobacterium antarcticum TaxID=271155 RepID=UPI0003B524F2|nr:hypothetical protein [Flavobacterium antarcticum]
MEENNKPTYEEWRIKFPNSTLNEYYSWIGKNGLVSQITRPQEIYIRKEDKVNYNNDYFALIVGVIACSLGLIGFFTPWLSIPIFNITISGNEINQLANFVEKMNQNKEVIKDVSYAKYVYVLPVNLVLLLLANLVKNGMLISIFTISLIAVIGLAANFIFTNIPEAFPMFSYGIYLIFFSTIINIYNLFNIKF